jgi:transcriptional regulator with XRE-family HTH domain
MTPTSDSHRAPAGPGGSAAGSPAPSSGGGPETRRRELADFLRTRRARVAPEDVGLPRLGRRRTPGLRREEVAQLAGVGVTWYTWLEQGRDINASPQVVDAVARALRLDQNERRHLHLLAGHSTAPPAAECAIFDEAERMVFDQLMPFPTVALTGRKDIIAYNANYQHCIIDLAHVPLEDRNTLVLAFTNDDWRRAIRNFDEVAPHAVASFRVAFAANVGDPLWESLVDRLRLESTLFDRLWKRHDIAPMQFRDKLIESPAVGTLRMRATVLGVSWAASARVSICTPADDLTHRRLERLAEYAAGHSAESPRLLPGAAASAGPAARVRRRAGR